MIKHAQSSLSPRALIDRESEECVHISPGFNWTSVARSSYRNERRRTKGKQKTGRSIRLVLGGGVWLIEAKITKQKCVRFFFRQHFFNTKSTYLHTQWFLTNYCRVRSNSLNVIALGPHTKENNSAEYGNFIIFLFSLAVCIRFLSLFLLLLIFILLAPPKFCEILWSFRWLLSKKSLASLHELEKE